MSDVEALRYGLSKMEGGSVRYRAEQAFDALLARLEQTEQRQKTLSDHGHEWEQKARDLQVRLEQAERVNRGRYGEVITDLQARAEALERALRALLRDDDLPPEWADCDCSMCNRIREARAALASEGEEQQVPDRILGVDLTNG